MVREGGLGGGGLELVLRSRWWGGALAGLRKGGWGHLRSAGAAQSQRSREQAQVGQGSEGGEGEVKSRLDQTLPVQGGCCLSLSLFAPDPPGQIICLHFPEGATSHGKVPTLAGQLALHLLPSSASGTQSQPLGGGSLLTLCLPPALSPDCTNEPGQLSASLACILGFPENPGTQP